MQPIGVYEITILYRTNRMCVCVCVCVCVPSFVKFRFMIFSLFFVLVCNLWSLWVFFPFSLLRDPFSLFSNSLFFSPILFGLTSSIRFFFFFCLFCYMICSVVIDIFAASPPSWKPSDFNVRLCLALLELSLYRYNSFIPSNTLTHSALSLLYFLRVDPVSSGPSFVWAALL